MADLEITEQIGDEFFYLKILDDSYSPNIADRKSSRYSPSVWNKHVGKPCPRCNSADTCCIKEGWYCNNCALLWKWMKKWRRRRLEFYKLI